MTETTIDEHTRRLERAYDDYLDAFELRRALARELALEDDLLHRVQDLLQRTGHAELVGDFAGPRAFCGGGADAQRLLREVSVSMSRAGLEVPEHTVRLFEPDSAGLLVPQPMFCGLVPDGDLGVQVRTEHGERGLVLFDVGLWFFLRLGVQALAAELAAVTGDPRWGPDRPGDSPMAGFRDRLDGYLCRNETLRQDTVVRVMQGPRETMRRALNLACIVWILGHEYAHLTAPTAVPPPAAPATWSERTEGWSSRREWEADRIADALVRTPWFGIDPVAAVLAPVFVQTVQAFILRSNHAAGRNAPSWTHEPPELRTLESIEALAAVGGAADEEYRLATRAKEWMWTQMRTSAMYAADVPEGIVPLSPTNTASRPGGSTASST